MNECKKTGETTCGKICMKTWYRFFLSLFLLIISFLTVSEAKPVYAEEYLRDSGRDGNISWEIYQNDRAMWRLKVSGTGPIKTTAVPVRDVPGMSRLRPGFRASTADIL